jgi:UDP-glucuronate 4-epimerase
MVRHSPKKPRLVYASSSSVYGANSKAPFSEEDRVDNPVSLYAATKRSNELMSESYTRLYGMEQIGLRFFTVYGPWGRPDMAYWSFTRDIIEGRPIRVFNNGQLKRDFTWIDDIVAGVVATAIAEPATKTTRHRVYNIGNNRPVELGRFIEIVEQAVGREAKKIMEPMQPGDVLATFANVDAISRDYGFAPRTPLEKGIQRFVEWYRAYSKT